jgi:hypothetical protein
LPPTGRPHTTGQERSPCYAGAFCFGRTRTRKHPDGHTLWERLPAEQWIALIRDAHPGYITWAQYEQNLAILRDNLPACDPQRERGAPREGPALLQGLAICAKCGERVTVRYHARGSELLPDYLCQRHGIEHAQPVCRSSKGAELDAAISRLLVEMVTPVTLEVALAVRKKPTGCAARKSSGPVTRSIWRGAAACAWIRIIAW